MEGTKAASIEDTFRPAFEEIQRRTDACRTQEHGRYFEPTADATRLPFHLPDQDFVLVTMGTAVLAPRPADATRPAVRVYGAFATREDAVEHAEHVTKLDGDAYSMMIVARNEWVLLPQTEAARDDPEENKRRRELRLQAYRVRQAEDGDAFMRAVQEGIERPAPNVEPPEDAETAEAEALVYKPPRRLRAGGEVRGQSALALCAVPDDVGGECLIKVLGCFESTAEAENWVHNVATRHITDDDVLIAATCDWFYPNGKKNASHELYRNKELQRIMDAAERNPAQVQQYKDWMRAQDAMDQNDRGAIEE